MIMKISHWGTLFIKKLTDLNNFSQKFFHISLVLQRLLQGIAVFISFDQVMSMDGG